MRRLQVALFGFGVVGEGVFLRLLADAERFSVVGVACRNPARHIKRGAPARLFGESVEALPPHDILVEAVGGVSAAGDAVLAALARGVDVVTSNKTLVSRRFDELHAVAARSDAVLRYSAAVGGGVPMLETVEDAAGAGAIARLDAVVNGTTNFVLDRMGAGLSLADAIALARDAGFAEADPSADIDGVDAAEKLSLLARRAFGVAIAPDLIPRDRLETLSAEDVVAAEIAGTPFKQVASARRIAGGVDLSVRLTRVAAASPLAAPKREENCLVIEREFGPPIIIMGKGAGREPTAQSAWSDLDAIARLRLASRAFAKV